MAEINFDFKSMSHDELLVFIAQKTNDIEEHARVTNGRIGKLEDCQNRTKVKVAAIGGALLVIASTLGINIAGIV